MIVFLLFRARYQSMLDQGCVYNTIASSTSDDRTAESLWQNEEQLNDRGCSGSTWPFWMAQSCCPPPSTRCPPPSSCCYTVCFYNLQMSLGFLPERLSEHQQVLHLSWGTDIGTLGSSLRNEEILICSYTASCFSSILMEELLYTRQNGLDSRLRKCTFGRYLVAAIIDRHSSKLSKNETLSADHIRYVAFCTDTIAQFFAQVQIALLTRPRWSFIQVWNLDETGLTTGHALGSIRSHQVVSDSRKRSVVLRARIRYSYSISVVLKVFADGPRQLSGVVLHGVWKPLLSN